MRRALLLVLLTLYAASAAAQPERPAERKSYAKAYTYMVIGTVVPILLGSGLAETESPLATLGKVAVAGGFLVGPSAGRIYAGDRVLGTVLLRAAGSAAFTVGVATAFGGLCPDLACGPRTEDLGAVFFFGGLTAYGGSLLLDLVLTHRAVGDYNERQARFSLAPGYDANARVPTLGLRVTF